MIIKDFKIKETFPVELDEDSFCPKYKVILEVDVEEGQWDGHWSEEIEKQSYYVSAKPMLDSILEAHNEKF